MFDFSYLVRNFDATEVPVLSIAMEKNFGRRLSAKAAMEFAVQRRMQLACRTWCIFALGPLAVYVLFAVHLMFYAVLCSSLFNLVRDDWPEETWSRIQEKLPHLTARLQIACPLARLAVLEWVPPRQWKSQHYLANPLPPSVKIRESSEM